MSVEQLIIERFTDTLSADATFANANIVGANNIERNDGRASADNQRRCELRVISSRPDDVWLSDGTLTTAWNGAIQVDVVMPRATAFGAANNEEHAGDMDTALDRLEALFHKQTISVTGFGLATLVWESTGVGAASNTEARRYSIFRFSLLTGSNRRINGADITVEASGLGDRVILGYTVNDTRELLENTGWTDCSRSFVTGNRLRRLTLLVASTSAAGAHLDVEPGTELDAVTINRAGTSYDVNLLVHAVRPVPVRAGASDLHYTELSCVVNG